MLKSLVSLVLLFSSGAALSQEACTASTGDVPGFTRQCAGVGVSQGVGLASVAGKWDNTLATVMRGPYPGGKAAFGQKLTLTINKNQFVSMAFNTGAATQGLWLEQNGTFGLPGLISVSTNPGDFFGGSAVTSCSPRPSMQISMKAVSKNPCKLQPNTAYYLNVAGMDYFPPHEAIWPDQAATVYGWTPYLYNN